MNEIKKADEVVRALRCCLDLKEECGCEDCVLYRQPCDGTFYGLTNAAADLIESLTAQLNASRRREKAAVEDINLLEDCSVCKHHDLDSCDLAGTKCHFEWRGPQAEKGEAE